MNRNTSIAAVALVAILGALVPAAHAADAAPPQVTAGGSGEVRIPPTHASFSVSIQTSA